MSQSNCKVAKCDCKHEFQDKTYGPQMRVMNNASAKGNMKERYKCTVCKKEHRLASNTGV